jgi:hypothetical protein
LLLITISSSFIFQSKIYFMIENLLFERTPPNHYFLAQVYHLSSTVTKKCQDGIRKQLKEGKLKFILAKHKNVFFFFCWSMALDIFAETNIYWSQQQN